MAVIAKYTVYDCFNFYMVDIIYLTDGLITRAEFTTRHSRHGPHIFVHNMLKYFILYK